MNIRMIISILFALGFHKTIIAGELINLTSPVLYYECIDCVDVPNIDHPSYAVLYKPIINDFNKYKLKNEIVTLLNLTKYLKKQVTLINSRSFYLPEARLMLIGYLDYPVMLDRYGYVLIGADCYKLNDEALVKLDLILEKEAKLGKVK